MRQEPFVSRADDIMDILTKDIPDAASEFKLVFSPQPFPGYAVRFELEPRGFRGQLVSMGGPGH
ncbi:MAG: hypothetical protein ABMA01_22020 [Chthoniobacteraceae bacterium]